MSFISVQFVKMIPKIYFFKSLRIDKPQNYAGNILFNLIQYKGMEMTFKVRKTINSYLL